MTTQINFLHNVVQAASNKHLVKKKSAKNKRKRRINRKNTVTVGREESDKKTNTTERRLHSVKR